MKIKNCIVCFLLLSVSVVSFVSCESTMNVQNPFYFIPCSDVKKEGKIYTGNKKNDNDIFISVLNVSEFKYELFIPMGKYGEKINIHCNNIVYPIKITYTKVLDKRYWSDLYDRIKINFTKKYKVQELHGAGISAHEYDSMVVTEQMLPTVITSFQIDGRKFYVVACRYQDDRSVLHVWDLVMLKDQEFVIVDEMHNEYASFTKTDFRICDQPDSADYDFIPLIAAYSYIFSFVR